MNRSRIATVVLSVSLVLAAGQAAYGFGMSGGGGHAQAAPESVAPITGKVIETMDSGGYTYAQIEQADGKKLWLAFPRAKVVKGETMSFSQGGVMKEFESKTLNRKFDEIIFSGGPMQPKADKKDAAEIGKDKNAQDSAPKSKEQEAAEGGSPGSKGSVVTVSEAIKVDKAEGPDAYTVGELVKNIATLDQKKVVIRAKVVKVAEGIMNKNWIHMQDGTGEAGSKDLVVTSNELATVGDVVTVSGTAVKDKDFGAGYKYAVIVEDGTFKK